MCYPAWHCSFLLFSRHWNPVTLEETGNSWQLLNHWYFWGIAHLKGEGHSIYLDLLERSTNDALLQSPHIRRCNAQLVKPISKYKSLQRLNLRAKFIFANMLKMIRKSGKLRGWPNLRTIFNIFSKFDIWVLQHPNSMHKNFHKVFNIG